MQPDNENGVTPPPCARGRTAAPRRLHSGTIRANGTWRRATQSACGERQLATTQRPNTTARSRRPPAATSAAGRAPPRALGAHSGGAPPQPTARLLFRRHRCNEAPCGDARTAARTTYASPQMSARWLASLRRQRREQQPARGCPRGLHPAHRRHRQTETTPKSKSGPLEGGRNHGQEGTIKASPPEGARQIGPGREGGHGRPSSHNRLLVSTTKGQR